MAWGRGNVELARHVRDKIFRLEDFCQLLQGEQGVSLNAFMYCVHRINHYGVLSFNWVDARSLLRRDGQYLQLVRGLWPEMNLAQRFEVAISLAKLHQRHQNGAIFLFIKQFLQSLEVGHCHNYTFNQLMHIAIIVSNKEVFNRCLALAAAAEPGDLLLASKLALVKNLSKFAAPDRAVEAETAFRRYFTSLELAELSVSELLSLYFSANLLLKKFPEGRVFSEFIQRLDRQLVGMAVSCETIYRSRFVKVLSGSKLLPTFFFFKWLKVVLRAPPSFSRHVTLAEALEQLTPALLTPDLLAYFVYEHSLGRQEKRRETLQQLQRLLFTPENSFLLEMLPDTPLAFLAERLRLLADQP